jgi:hypothetical protein
MELRLPNRQRFGIIQHIVREDLENTAEMGDEVTSLCGDVTYRIRHKDNPNMLVCGMCALLMVREYRELLTESSKIAHLGEALIEELQVMRDEAEARAEGFTDDPDVAPPVRLPEDDSHIEDVALPEDEEER